MKGENERWEKRRKNTITPTHPLTHPPTHPSTQRYCCCLRTTKEGLKIGQMGPFLLVHELSLISTTTEETTTTSHSSGWIFFYLSRNFAMCALSSQKKIEWKGIQIIEPMSVNSLFKKQKMTDISVSCSTLVWIHPHSLLIVSSCRIHPSGHSLSLYTASFKKTVLWG